ncbi:hypothetical protein BU26DRAFT_128463 [Trematosphaeria pertusa]|uniref:Uncharacterized protein n=1 Tax=Trematosphaeria pertusa TaxID=390896 RepID=A0A6A6HWI2_9PLEO|nr:uncharacterized protein BU26DRAFT_128463 [Trematosphaeria pertusa]KAF2242555.1 hypothetical protein BU26DRAFT_128463 [Trematosphaeria pertusa]
MGMERPVAQLASPEDVRPLRLLLRHGRLRTQPVQPPLLDLYRAVFQSFRDHRGEVDHLLSQAARRFAPQGGRHSQGSGGQGNRGRLQRDRGYPAYSGSVCVVRFPTTAGECRGVGEGGLLHSFWVVLVCSIMAIWLVLKVFLASLSFSYVTAPEPPSRVTCWQNSSCRPVTVAAGTSRLSISAKMVMPKGSGPAMA